MHLPVSVEFYEEGMADDNATCETMSLSTLKHDLPERVQLYVQENTSRDLSLSMNRVISALFYFASHHRVYYSCTGQRVMSF